MQFPAEGRQLVIQRPQGLAALGSCQHVFRAAFRHGVVQQREYGDQLRRRLDIEVVHAHAGDDTLRVVLDGLAQLAEGEEYPHAVVVQVRAGFQRRGVAAGRLEVAVVFLLPLVYPVELGGDAVLQRSRLGLSLYLFVNLAVYKLVPFGKGHPFQRVGGRYLRLRKLRQQECEHGGKADANGS